MVSDIIISFELKDGPLNPSFVAEDPNPEQQTVGFLFHSIFKGQTTDLEEMQEEICCVCKEMQQMRPKCSARWEDELQLCLSPSTYLHSAVKQR